MPPITMNVSLSIAVGTESAFLEGDGVPACQVVEPVGRKCTAKSSNAKTPAFNVTNRCL